MRTVGSLQVVLISIGLLVVVSSHGFPPDEVDALNTFKQAIYEDRLMVLSTWNALDADPCDWSGIFCSKARDHVVKLNISEASLKGFLVPELRLLSTLEELILHGNMLIGTIPKEIGMLKNLRVLDLGANQLTGPIPPEIGNLTNIVKINLQSNGLTGRLPPEIGNLKYLEELRLDRNKLQGMVPISNSSSSTAEVHGMYASRGNPAGFCRPSPYKVADFSYNFFIGSIPKCLNYLPKTSFQGNCLHNTDPKQRPITQCGEAPPAKAHPGVSMRHRSAEDAPKRHAASKPAWLLALEVVTGVMVGSLFLVALLTARQKWKGKSSIIIPWKKSGSDKDYMTNYVVAEMLKDVVTYSRQELELACEEFSNIIGSSSDSLVYKGTLKSGPEIAVISLCIKEEQWTPYLELYFQNEVSELARIDHENTGKLLGYCRESSPFTRMLVFEYASNGTLYEHLHYGEGCQLSWTRRMRIVIGVAKGLKYLHTELNPPFTIYELTSNAVYLTEDFSPKLVDFDSWKTILPRSEKSSDTISNEGPVCVLPDSIERRHLDVQGNIYAFGVLLLEIISGRPPHSQDNGSLVDWAREFLELPEVMSNVVDPGLKHFRQEDLKTICEVISLCINSRPEDRISMKDLCNTLESNIDLLVTAELRASSLAWAELALSS